LQEALDSNKQVARGGPDSGMYPFGGGTTGVPTSHTAYDDFATFPNTSDVGVVVLDQPVVMATYGTVAAVGALEGIDTARGLKEQVFRWSHFY
jgi:hypothetical protein